MQQVNENQFLFNIPDADNVNHIVVFMTGLTPFPDGMGAAGMFDFENGLQQTLNYQIVKLPVVKSCL